MPISVPTIFVVVSIIGALISIQCIIQIERVLISLHSLQNAVIFFLQEMHGGRGCVLTGVCGIRGKDAPLATARERYIRWGGGSRNKRGRGSIGEAGVGEG